MAQTTNNPENDILVMDVYLIITDGKTVADVRFCRVSVIDGLQELKEVVNSDISEFVICFQSLYFADPKDIKTIIYPVVSQMTKQQYMRFESNYPAIGLTKLTHDN